MITPARVTLTGFGCSGAMIGAGVRGSAGCQLVAYWRLTARYKLEAEARSRKRVLRANRWPRHVSFVR